MADDPLIGAALPSDDPASIWLASLVWAFGDMQIAHVYLVEGHDKLSAELSEGTLLYGWRLAMGHYFEAARLCRLYDEADQPEIRGFYASLPEATQQLLVDALAMHDKFRRATRALRNGFFHYPYPAGVARRTKRRLPDQVAWDALSARLASAKDRTMTTTRGKIRHARHTWADELTAETVAAATGGVPAYAKIAKASGESVTGLMRFINAAIDERMSRAVSGLPLNEPRLGQ